jgi:uncharacterized repeat protein (TIGR03803 family)
VFATTTSGKEKVLHSFGGEGDGGTPFAGLANVNGTLYGTTYTGGANDDGTVFAITTSGAETILHSFNGRAGDGVAPQAGLVDVNGTLYGTTFTGGENGDGTVFAITTSGTETVLYSFGGGATDGAFPQAGLLSIKGALYGTTYAGGVHCNSRGRSGCGTAFSITTSGSETVLYRFKARFKKDGAHPEGGLIDVNGTLYGTTSTGGTYGDGTVFALKL